MKYKVALVVTLFFILISIVWAVNSGNTGTYDEETKTYTINKSNGKLLAEITLKEYSKECLILEDCYMFIDVQIFEITNDIFNDEIKLKNKKNKEINKTINLFMLEQNNWTEKKQKYETVCDDYIDTNGTPNSNCLNLDNGTEDINHSDMVWNIVENKKLSIGNYTLRFQGSGGLNYGLDIIPSFFGVQASEWIWWDNSWNKKQQIILNETAGIGLENYTINLTIHWNEYMNGSFQDLRFLNSSQSGEYNYWLQNIAFENRTNVSIFINEEVPSNGQLNFYVYYNNTNVINESSEQLTYIVYDNFDDNVLDTTKWNISSVSSNLTSPLDVSEEGSVLKINGTGIQNGGTRDSTGDAHAKAVSYAEVGQYAEIKADILIVSSTGEGQHGMVGFRNETADSPTPGAQKGQQFGVGQTRDWVEGTGSNNNLTLASQDGTWFQYVDDSVQTDGAYHTYRLIRYSDLVSVYRDDVFRGNVSWNNSGGRVERDIMLLAMPRIIGNYVDARFDNVKAKNYIMPEPYTINFGSTNTVGNTSRASFTIYSPLEGENITSGDDILFNWTVDSFGVNATCVYNVEKLAGIEVENTTIDCQQNLSYFNVTTVTDYALNFYVDIETAGKANSTKINFTVSTVPPPPQQSEGGGGGGTSKTVCITNETAWKITTDTGGDQYLLLMGPGQKRSKTILISNQQSTGKLNITVSCHDVNGTGCSNTEFAEKELSIDPSLFAERELLFTIELPDDFEEDVTLFNVVLTDQVLCENLLPVKLQKSVITGFISRLIQTIEFTFLKKISDGFPIIKIWLWAIILSISIPSGVIINIVLQKLKIYKMKTPPRAIGIVIGVIIAILLFIFI